MKTSRGSCGKWKGGVSVVIRTIKTACGKCGVELIRNGGSILAFAVTVNDCQYYGKTSYWFKIGSYRTEKNAVRQSVKKMAEMGKELVLT